MLLQIAILESTSDEVNELVDAMQEGGRRRRRREVLGFARTLVATVGSAAASANFPNNPRLPLS
jgi:hypothetical protein